MLYNHFHCVGENSEMVFGLDFFENEHNVGKNGGLLFDLRVKFGSKEVGGHDKFKLLIKAIEMICLNDKVICVVFLFGTRLK